jgi:signal transduction histidine kinase
MDRDAGDALPTVREINTRLRHALLDLAEREATIRRQAERLALLNEFARLVGGSLDLGSIFGVVVRQVAAYLGAARCSVARYERAEDVFCVAAAWQRDDAPPFPDGDVFPSGESSLGIVLRTRAPLVTPDTRVAPAEPLRRLGRQGLLSVASVPIIMGGGVWGALNVAYLEPGAATDEHADFLAAIATHLSVAIHNAELYARLRAAHEELQRTQEQVVQQERLRALGQMASGIAHDLNNALAPVVGFTDLLLSFPSTLDDREKTLRLLRLVQAGAADAASVVARLKEFYRQRGADEVLVPVSLAQVAEVAVALAQPRWKDQAQASGATISVRTELGEAPPIAGHEPELREALVNLLFNAVDALPDGGDIVVRTYGRTGGGSGGREEAHAVLEVADTGAGMPEEVRRRCLEPFFTTKGEMGTGMGLAMVYGTMTRHGGTLEVDSAPGRGTTIRLVFPAGGRRSEAGSAGGGRRAGAAPHPGRVPARGRARGGQRGGRR